MSTSARMILVSGLVVHAAIPRRSRISLSVAPKSFQTRNRIFSRPLSLPFVGNIASLPTTVSLSDACFHSAMVRNGRRLATCLASSSGRKTIGGSSSCPICRSPVSSDFSSSPTVTDITTSTDSVCRFLVRLRLKIMSSQLPSFPHRKPAFSNTCLASSAEAHLAFVILMTTSLMPNSSMKCQEDNPFLFLASCKHGHSMLEIHSRPSRSKPRPSSTE